MTKKLRIIIGSDDAGFEYKTALLKELENDPRVEAVFDIGIRAKDDRFYPHIALAAAQRIAVGEADRALLICGTGLGMAISANKVAGIRAVTAHDGYSVERSVLSNNAQVLCVGQRVIGLELARHLVNIWLSVHFDETSASAEKVAVIDNFEKTGINAPVEQSNC